MKSLIFKLWIIFFGVFFCISNTQAFFEIVEVFPNTVDDKNLEYIILENISQESQSLSGYILEDKKKEYIISEDIFLESGGTRKFFRTETGITLNNVNEELRLISPNGEVVHEVAYKSSVKGVFLSFRDVEKTIEETRKEIISDEVILEIISEEAVVSILDTIVVIEDKDERVKEREAPELVFSLQRPSYIELSEEHNVYICDGERDECKVNFDLRNSFGDDFLEKDYICNIDFGIPGFESQEERCNPNTVVFPEGENKVVFQIFHEDDATVFSENVIYIQNTPQNISESQSEQSSEEGAESDIPKEPEETEESEKLGDGEEGEDFQNLEIQELFEIPDITLGFQIPSYVEFSEEHNAYICDSKRDECKVNFDLRNSFGDDFLEKDYICNIDFGIPGFESQEERCNPNTVTFPEGEYKVIFKIFHEDNKNIFSQKVITIQNIAQDNIYLNTGVTSSDTTESSKSSEEKMAKIQINSPRIIVQSGLEGTNRYYQCLKETCRINLNYEKQHSDEQCLWSFGGGKTSSSSTRERCNPGFVTYEKGVHELSLKVYEKDNKQNYKKHIFYVYNNLVTLREEEVLVDNNKQENTEIPDNIKGKKSEDIKIVLQGKMGKEKKVVDENNLECWGVEKCYINLNGEVSLKSKNLNYIWKLNGEIFSEKQNPKGIWLELGAYTLEFEIIKNGDIISKKHFYVGVNSNKYDENNILEEDLALKDSSNNSEEYKKGNIEDGEKQLSKSALKKIFTQNFLVLKYDGLRISGKAPTGSKVEIYLDGEKILEGAGDKKGKYKILTKTLKTGKYTFDTKIIYASGEELYIKKSGTFEILEEKIQNWISESESEKKKKNKALKKIFTQNFLVLKYDGLRISGKAPVDSRVEIFLDGKKILAGVGDKKGKYRLVTKNLKAGKYTFDTKIIYPNREILYIENSGEFEILNSKIGNWFAVKKKKASSKTKSNFKFPKLILEANAYSDFDSHDSEELDIFRKIIFIASLSFLILLAMISIILKNVSPVNIFILESQRLSFSVRQRICILV